MDALTQIVNIICKRDNDTYQDISRDTDHEMIMADAIDAVLNDVYEDGVKAGIEKERDFWTGTFYEN